MTHSVSVIGSTYVRINKYLNKYSGLFLLISFKRFNFWLSSDKFLMHVQDFSNHKITLNKHSGVSYTIHIYGAKLIYLLSKHNKIFQISSHNLILMIPNMHRFMILKVSQLFNMLACKQPCNPRAGQCSLPLTYLNQKEMSMLAAHYCKSYFCLFCTFLINKYICML